jgi:hypothetical protein
VTFPDAASLATPAGNGAIGAARETPTPAAKMKAATAIANETRIMHSSYGRINLCQSHNTEASSPFPQRRDFKNNNEQSVIQAWMEMNKQSFSLGSLHREMRAKKSIAN